MGLTVHFQLSAPAATTAADAQRLVLYARRIAQRFQREGWVADVSGLREDPTTLRCRATDWLTWSWPGEPNTVTGAEISPVAGWLFRVDVGRDCEPLWLGLCRYPETICHAGRELQTRKGRGWRLSGFSKTQFASLHGWEHFLRCHRAVVELLASLRPPGLRVRITDEGDYWPRRSVAALRRNVDEMNGIVAAAAGALKDMDEAGNGRSVIESPIFRHPRYERLEAEGAVAAAPLTGLLDAVSRSHRRDAK